MQTHARTRIPLLSYAAPLALALTAGLLPDAKADVTTDSKTDTKDGPGALITGDFQHRARSAGARVVTGKFTPGATTDIAVLGGVASAPDAQIWILAPLLNGGVFEGYFDLLKNTNVDATNLANASTMRIDAGDFNLDGLDDILFLGTSGVNTGVYRLFLSNGNGFFTTQAGISPSATFRALASASGARVFACDVSGDGRSDIVVTGGSGQTNVAVAFTQTNGTYVESYKAVPTFTTLASANPSAKMACDDFNGDGKDDLILTGISSGTTVPVAFASPLGTGDFALNNYPDPSNPSINTSALTAGAQMVTGDFNNDGDADLFFTGASSWFYAPIGISLGFGTFGSTLGNISDVAYWSREWGSKMVGGDFNGDGKDDAAVVGGADYFYTLPLALSNGTGTYDFTIMNPAVP